MPRVSVILGVRDGMPWLPEAVASVLGQTLADLELVIVDDGSADGTAAWLAGLPDARVRVLHQAPAGLARALNRGVAASGAPLIARMDADDVALPERLARQAEYLDRHPEVGILGTGWRVLGPGGEVLEPPPPPADDAAIRAALPRRNPLAHPTVMLRRAVGDRAGWYDERLPVAQDYDLWLRLLGRTRFANLPEPLLLRRYTAAMTSLARDDARLAAELVIRWRAIRRGDLPPRALVHLVRPALGRALPPALRAAWRRRRRDGVGLVLRAGRERGGGRPL
jgi:glycosyltransferase involved in cell wall biosynthesis